MRFFERNSRKWDKIINPNRRLLSISKINIDMNKKENQQTIQCLSLKVINVIHLINMLVLLTCYEGLFKSNDRLTGQVSDIFV